MTIYTDNDGNPQFDLYDCYKAKEYNHNCKHQLMDNVYIIPTKKAKEKYGADKLHVVVLKRLSNPTESMHDMFTWNYKAEDCMLIPLLDFEKVVGSIPQLNSFPIATGWKVYLG